MKYLKWLVLCVSCTLSEGHVRAVRDDIQQLPTIVSKPFNTEIFAQIKKCICDLEKTLSLEIDQLICDLNILVEFQGFQNHQGAKENFAGNNATGQSAQVLFDVDPLDAVQGTRVSDTTFTRDSGTFETPIITGLATAGGANTITLSASASAADDFYNTNIISITAGTGVGQIRTISDYVGATQIATVSVAWVTVPDATSEFEIVSGIFVGQYAFSFGGFIAPLIGTWPPPVQILSDITDGVWLPIVQNTSTSIVVDGTLNAIGTAIITSVFNPAANLYPHNKGGLAFSGGVFDGKYLWLSPYISPDIVRVNPATGEMVSTPHDKNVIRAFGDAVYDGETVWLVPYSSPDIIRIAADGTLTSVAHGKGEFAFWGGTFDGTNIWFAPQLSPDILKIDPATGAMTSIPHNKGGFAFLGAVYDGFNVWLVPQGSADIVKINPETNALTSIPHNKGAFAFAGGVFDGRYVWMFPFNSADIIRINPATNEIESFPQNQGAFAFLGGSFDGKNIWMAPQFATNIVKIDPTTGELDSFPHGQGTDFVYWGSVFDGKSVWFIPSNSANLWRLLPPRTGKDNTNISGALSVGGTFTRAGALRDASIQLETPSSGDTVFVSANTDMLILNPAGALATLTITLPSGSDIDQGQIVTIASDQAIAAVTLNGGTINGAITSLGANDFAQYIYELSTNVWYRIG